MSKAFGIESHAPGLAAILSGIVAFLIIQATPVAWERLPRPLRVWSTFQRVSL